ncbi:endonuclease/exonuclease/phosphatase family protein [Marixanthomonas spongiae]|uniref:Endonuclease n=1 Tax=Marixanthomonas spongiae TaxID=2174845 RepID=A0A2U0HXF7_9FLAO|nr:endonuclease/exonuclease/phosphatase family protein [Marixanthomonas spongiae]PVW13509.1 endonuclease [Marixanthomonas spongiae]
MKKEGCVTKIVFWGNSFVAFLLLLSFVLPYLPPSKFPTLSLLSLLVSPLIVLNLLFAVYWLVRLKRKFLLSAIILVVAYMYFNPFFEISSEGNSSAYKKTITVLSYNVRLFNAYEDNPASEDVSKTFSEILKKEKPDVISVQEYYIQNKVDFSEYPYQYINFKEKNKLGHAIFSKFPIIHKGAFNFSETSNNAIYADIVKNDDTLRVYNVHLQSMGIKPRVSYLQENDKTRLRKRITDAFVKQEGQIAEIKEHKAKTPYKTMVMGDFNNTSFSYIYKKMTANMQDAFLKQGNGIGTTFKFDFYPMRIDFILSSNDFEVLSFKTMDQSFSDHFPVSATLGWE